MAARRNVLLENPQVKRMNDWIPADDMHQPRDRFQASLMMDGAMPPVGLSRISGLMALPGGISLESQHLRASGLRLRRTRRNAFDRLLAALG
jgi:hypothetical protein